MSVRLDRPEDELAEIKDAMPGSFYIHLPLPQRVRFLVDQWRRLHKVNKELERQLDAVLGLPPPERSVIIIEGEDE